MVCINIEEQNGIETRYVGAQDGIRLYSIPYVPIDAGEIPTEESFDLEGGARLYSHLKGYRVELVLRKDTTDEGLTIIYSRKSSNCSVQTQLSKQEVDELVEKCSEMQE